MLKKVMVTICPKRNEQKFGNTPQNIIKNGSAAPVFYTFKNLPISLALQLITSSNKYDNSVGSGFISTQ